MTGDRCRILVTGASSGIGAATCRRLAGPGRRIAVHARRNRDGAERTADAVRQAGGEAEILLHDLARPGEGGGLVAEAIGRLGGLDVLVANAGFADSTPLSKVDLAVFDHSQAVIARAFVEMAQAAGEALRASPCGRAIAVSAFGPHVWRTQVRTFPASAAAKAALEAAARALALELAPSGATCNIVVPGFVRKDPGAHRAMTPEALQQVTAQIPLGRIGTPEDVAAVIAFLCSPEAAYVTGQRIHVDGGLV